MQSRDGGPSNGADGYTWEKCVDFDFSWIMPLESMHGTSCFSATRDVIAGFEMLVLVAMFFLAMSYELPLDFRCAKDIFTMACIYFFYFASNLIRFLFIVNPQLLTWKGLFHIVKQLGFYPNHCWFKVILYAWFYRDDIKLITNKFIIQKKKLVFSIGVIKIIVWANKLVTTFFYAVRKANEFDKLSQ